MSNNNKEDEKKEQIQTALRSSLDNIIKHLTNRDESSNGLIGLKNLGNTCFMNSALQCLSNSTALTKYFLTELYQKELNPKTNHQVVESYSELLTVIWASPPQYQYHAISPMNFRGVFCGYAQQFSGYSQHDSQEFLIYLLDKIHDDLNRIVDKPYIAINEDGENDPNVCWERYKKRDDSIIVDLFQGQLKNKLKCDVCGHVNSNYDTFMMLPLPIPQETKKLSVVYINKDNVISNFDITFDELTIEKIKCSTLDQFKIEAIEIVIIDNQGRIVSIIDEENEYKLQELYEGIKRKNLFMLIYEKEKINIYISPCELIMKYQYYIVPYLDVNILSFPIVIHVTSTMTANDISDKLNSLFCMTSYTLYLVNYENEQLCMFCGNFNCRFCSFNKRFSQNESIAYMLSKSEHIYLYADFQNENINPYSKVLKMLIDATGNIFSNLSAKSKNKKKAISIYQCLDLFLKEEKLTTENQWYCPKCKEHRNANQKLDLYRCPPYLIIQFKRFKSFTTEQSHRSFADYFLGNSHCSKNQSRITYPVSKLDLSKYVLNNQNAVYDLYGVIQHFGGVSFGHYIALCKNEINNKWYEYDDGSIVEKTIEEVEDNQSAYLLFYKLHNN